VTVIVPVPHANPLAPHCQVRESLIVVLLQNEPIVAILPWRLPRIVSWDGADLCRTLQGRRDTYVENNVFTVI
jgi:hypothetical protein